MRSRRDRPRGERGRGAGRSARAFSLLETLVALSILVLAMSLALPAILTRAVSGADDPSSGLSAFVAECAARAARRGWAVEIRVVTSDEGSRFEGRDVRAGDATEEGRRAAAIFRLPAGLRASWAAEGGAAGRADDRAELGESSDVSAWAMPDGSIWSRGQVRVIDARGGERVVSIHPWTGVASLLPVPTVGDGPTQAPDRSDEGTEATPEAADRGSPDSGGPPPGRQP